MLIYGTIYEARSEIKRLRQSGKKIGFVPTMGALHQGHLSLLEKARAENDVLVLSVFVNPLQFAPHEDFEKYPKTFEQDCQLASAVGTDIVFAPTVEEMYSKKAKTYITVSELTDYLCGEKRVGHFKGVATVVAKLLNILPCDKIYLGQKDYQQFLVVKQMLADLNFDTEAVMCPIVREPNGLAMSSRNKYLNEDERAQALCLFEALDAARALIIDQKMRETVEIEHILRVIIEKKPAAKIDYIFIGEAESLTPITHIQEGSQILVALAVFIGQTRLIDNVLLEVSL